MSRTSITSKERMDIGAAIYRSIGRRRSVRADGMGVWPDPDVLDAVLVFMNEGLNTCDEGAADVLVGDSDGTPMDAARRALDRMIPSRDVLLDKVNAFMESHKGPEGVTLGSDGSGWPAVSIDPFNSMGVVTSLVSMGGRGMDDRFMSMCYRMSFPDRFVFVAEKDPPLSSVAMHAEGEGLPVMMDTYRSIDGGIDMDGKWRDLAVLDAVIRHESVLFDIRTMDERGCRYGGDPERDAWDASIAYAHADWMLPGFMDGPVSPMPAAGTIIREGESIGYDAMLMRLYRIMYSDDKDQERWMMNLLTDLNELRRTVPRRIGDGDAKDAIISYHGLADDLMNGYPVRFIAEGVLSRYGSD